MEKLNRIETESFFEGICFSDAVYFEDGKNMFLPGNKRAEKYHIDVLKKWNVPYLLTSGHIIDEPCENVSSKTEIIDEVEELEEVEEVEDLENVEDLESLD